jgi:precorrin-3B synthase
VTRDACPGVLRLHEAADGHLARVRLPGGRIDGRGLGAVALAATLGNDIVELTSRAGLQVRGLPGHGAEALALVLGAGGLVPSMAHDRVRNIAAPPLGGRGEGAAAETDMVVDRIDRALCGDDGLTALPGRFLFAVDDGTRALDPLVADVELAAEGEGFRLRLAGEATGLAVSGEEAGEAATRAARAFLELAGAEAPDAWRVRDLPGGGRRLAEHLGLDRREMPEPGGARAATARAAAAAPRRRPPAPLGVTPQRDGRAAVAALAPLARLDSGQLRALAELLAPGATVRFSPWRTLTFVDVPPGDARAFADELEALGLVVAPGSGWAGLSACAGLGACTRARADVRSGATLRAARRGDASPREHWSGCERGCGEPPDAAVTVVATPAGVLVNREGDAPRAVPSTVAAAELLSCARVPA